MHNNRYTFLFAIGISMITAVILVVTSQSLKPLQEENEALDKKKSILKSVRIANDDAQVIEKEYSTSVKELVVNANGEIVEGLDAKKVKLKDEVSKDPKDRMLPLYIYSKDSKDYYIVPMQGVGLWGPIWGYVSIEEDFNTVYGSFFDHKSETPGLGAEISEIAFQEQFQGKQLLNAGGSFLSVNVIKTTAKVDYGREHRVDAISGGTITSDGVDAMLKNCIEPYLAYFNKIKN